MKRSEYLREEKDLLLLEKILIEEYYKRLEKHSAKKGLRKIIKEHLMEEKISYDMQLVKRI